MSTTSPGRPPRRARAGWRRAGRARRHGARAPPRRPSITAAAIASGSSERGLSEVSTDEIGAARPRPRPSRDAWRGRGLRRTRTRGSRRCRSGTSHERSRARRRARRVCARSRRAPVNGWPASTALQATRDRHRRLEPGHHRVEAAARRERRGRRGERVRHVDATEQRRAHRHRVTGATVHEREPRAVRLEPTPAAATDVGVRCSSMANVTVRGRASRRASCGAARPYGSSTFSAAAADARRARTARALASK